MITHGVYIQESSCKRMISKTNCFRTHIFISTSLPNKITSYVNRGCHQVPTKLKLPNWKISSWKKMKEKLSLFSKTVIFVLKTVIFASSQGHHLLTLKLEAFLCSFVPQQLKHRNCCIKSIIQGIKIIRTTLKKRFVFHFHKTKMSV